MQAIENLDKIDSIMISLQKNKQKANRVANAANRAGGNVSVGKITGGQGVADF